MRTYIAHKKTRVCLFYFSLNFEWKENETLQMSESLIGFIFAVPDATQVVSELPDASHVKRFNVKSRITLHVSLLL